MRLLILDPPTFLVKKLGVAGEHNTHKSWVRPWAVFAPAEMNWVLGVQKNVQYTQKSHFICAIWIDIGRLWTPGAYSAPGALRKVTHRRKSIVYK